VNVIVPGLAMLGGAMDALDAREVVVSERDTLDGVAMGLVRTGNDPSP
jgi:exopolyphosphatase/pppGpp-phosphohydrolase